MPHVRTLGRGFAYLYPIELAGVVDLGKLTPPERLKHIAQLWDSLESEHVPLTADQREELDRRLETLDHDMKTAKPWNVLRAEMKACYR